MAKCIECGMHYDGWSCPFCNKLKEAQRNIEDLLDEKQEQQEDANQQQIEALVEIATAQAEVTAWQVKEQKRAVSEAWRLQAQNKTDRAYELYQAGLYDKAAKLSEEAIDQDSGNIEPYQIAVWSYKRIEKNDRVKELLKDQISLISTPDQKKSTRYAAMALTILNDILGTRDIELMRLYILKSETENFPYDFLGIACAIELWHRHHDEDLPDWIGLNFKKLDFRNCEEIFSLFKMGINCSCLSSNSIKQLHNRLLERYKEWGAEIKDQQYRDAQQKAMYDAENSGIPAFLGWGIGLVSIYPWYNLITSEDVARTLDAMFHSDNQLINVVLVFASLIVPPIICGLSISGLSMYWIKKNKIHQYMAAATKKEKALIGSIVLDQQ